MRLYIAQSREAKQARSGGRDVCLRFIAWLGGRRSERTQNCERGADAASRCVDGHVGRSLQLRDACAVLIPLCQTSLPALCRFGGIRLNGRVMTLRVASINPWREV